MPTLAQKATKHWAWDKIAEGFFAAVVCPSEDYDGTDPVTVTVQLERGSKAGGWWVYTTDSTWPAHFDTFAKAMAKAERIRLSREAEMRPLTIH